MIQSGSLTNAIIGAYFLITGTVMVVFHKHLKKLFEDLYSGIPGVVLLPRGRSLTVMIIVTGVLSVVGGLTLLLMYFVPA
ncbi:MAG TPA: hypothetical protein VFY67_19095 [Pyrinomonadaceae bacterium]|nr:hypothetical protein [Pyrinomonadaceae bacterium]